MGIRTTAMRTPIALLMAMLIAMGTASFSLAGQALAASASGSKLATGSAATVQTQASTPSVSYRAHIQKTGWLKTVSNGAVAGTTGQSLRMEGLQVKLVRKGNAFDTGGSATVTPAMKLNYKMNAFVNDGRWSHSTYWPQRRPEISTHDCTGCLAYACDFTKYVYGIDNCQNGARYTSVSEIRAGDVVHISGHWFVVISRNGNDLRTAEGAAYIGSTTDVVRVANPGYRISGAGLVDAVSGYGKSFVEGFHYSI